MRRYAAALLLATTTAFCLFASGCASSVELTQVKQKRTPQGTVTVLQKIPYRALEEQIEASGAIPTNLTNLDEDSEPRNFSVSPDGKWLVYQVLTREDNRPQYNIWRISTDGTGGKTQVTQGSYLDIEPCFSPDGSSIYFSSNRSSTLLDIWRVNVGGEGGYARITSSDSEDRAPSVGDKVYFESKPRTALRHQVWRINTTGNLPTQMREGASPRVSPDGKRVLYTERDRRTDNIKIWVMNSNGTNQTVLGGDNKHNQINPSWSPDGTKIVYCSDEGRDSSRKHNYDIWIMDANGSNPTQLTTNGSTDLLPQIDPANEHIYFLSNRGFKWDIWRMRIGS